MKKEIYSSFGRLEVGGPREGYTIYDIGKGMLECESVSIYSDIPTTRFRFPAELVPPERCSDSEYLTELLIDAQYGRRDGLQFGWHGRWYTPDMIDAVRAKYHDMWWQSHV